jgi:envelope integrity protein B
MRLHAALAALLLVSGWVVQPALAANSPPAAASSATSGLIAHRALYTLTLATAKSNDVVAARGTMGYEVTDACDGWAVRQRLRMTITNADGQDIEMASDYTTWEAKDGLKFRYHMRQTTETAVTSQTDGEAQLPQKTGNTGEARYTTPRNTNIALPVGTLFPMAHTAAIIAAAREKKHFLSVPLFDGTDENGAEDSFIVILDWKPPMQTKWPALSSLPSTRVHLSFFDRKPSTMTPTYEVGMRYWENGVADDMKMDFGEFVMNAKMKEFSPQPRKC